MANMLAVPTDGKKVQLNLYVSREANAALTKLAAKHHLRKRTQYAERVILEHLVEIGAIEEVQPVGTSSPEEESQNIPVIQQSTDIVNSLRTIRTEKMTPSKEEAEAIARESGQHEKTQLRVVKDEEKPEVEPSKNHSAKRSTKKGHKGK